MSTNEQPRCCESVYKLHRRYQCTRPGSIERDGQHYCKQHDPQAKKARREATANEYDARLEHEQKYKIAAGLRDATVEQLRAELERREKEAQ